MDNRAEFDFDQVIIGSGFGGAVSALRLNEKGHRVLVLEKGLRRDDSHYAANNMQLKSSLWEPKLGMQGVIQLSMTSKVNVIHGVGVGGGSQVYSAVNLIPEDSAFEAPGWQKIHSDWPSRLAPYYALAKRMLGSCTNPVKDVTDDALRSLAEQMGRPEAYGKVTSGILFAQGDQQPGDQVDDPYFAGDGPARRTCSLCGDCGTGCSYNAKNSLSKNYLYFAERNGVEIRSESEVVRIEPLADQSGNGAGNEPGSKDGSAGYLITVRHSLPKSRWPEYTIKTRGVVVAAGVMGSIPLLLKMRDQAKTLPGISSWLGQQVRTNSETLLGISDTQHETYHGNTISSKVRLDDTTTIEINRFGDGSDAAWLVTPYVPMISGEGLTRLIKWLGQSLRHPLKLLKMLNFRGKGRKSFVLLVMETRESYIHLEWRRRWYRLFRKGISTVQKAGDRPLSVSFPAAEKAAEQLADKLGGEAGSSLVEVLTGTPTTAHIMSGVPMGTDASNGVIDDTGQVFGYQNLRVLDGSVIPGNLGVNPSLTITALTEYAMSQLPVFDKARAAKISPIRFSEPLFEPSSQQTQPGEKVNSTVMGL